MSCTWTRLATTVPPCRFTCLVHWFSLSNSMQWLCCSTQMDVGVTSTPPAWYSLMPLTSAICLGIGVSILMRPVTLLSSPGVSSVASRRWTLLMIFFSCLESSGLSVSLRGHSSLHCEVLLSGRTPCTFTRPSRILFSMLVPILETESCTLNLQLNSESEGHPVDELKLELELELLYFTERIWKQ